MTLTQGAVPPESDYRICFNSAPHRPDWWTVECRQIETRKRWFRSPVVTEEWVTVKDYRRWSPGIYRVPLPALCFASREDAEAWVREDRKPRVHRCEPYSPEQP